MREAKVCLWLFPGLLSLLLEWTIGPPYSFFGRLIQGNRAINKIHFWMHAGLRSALVSNVTTRWNLHVSTVISEWGILISTWQLFHRTCFRKTSDDWTASWLLRVVLIIINFSEYSNVRKISGCFFSVVLPVFVLPTWLLKSIHHLTHAFGHVTDNSCIYEQRYLQPLITFDDVRWKSSVIIDY